MNIGDKILLHSYKHDQSLHRVWKTEVLLAEDDDLIIVANRKTRVVESNGRFWYTKEPSVSFFFKKFWFNVIGIIKNDTVGFYCNLSSPILRDDEALKYIDYDLDIKVDKYFNMTVLDRNEYNRNKKRMNYPESIREILSQEIEHLKEMIINREFPFTREYVLEWYHKYLSLEEKQSV